MSNSGDRNLAFLFGVLGALILILAGIFNFFGGFVLLAFGLGGHAVAAWGRSLVDLIVGILIGLFASIGRAGGKDRALSAGVILVVLAVVGWLGLGLGGGLLELLAALFALIAGVLYILASR